MDSEMNSNVIEERKEDELKEDEMKEDEIKENEIKETADIEMNLSEVILTNNEASSNDNPLISTMTTDKSNETLLNKKRNRSPDKSTSDDNNKDDNSIPKEIMNPTFKIPLVSLELFTELQPYKSFSQDKLNQAYNEYKTEHFLYTLNTFFKTHEDDEWFKEKFHCETYYDHKDLIKSQIHRLSIHFINQLATFADVSFQLTQEVKDDPKTYTVIETPFIPNDTKDSNDREKTKRNRDNNEEEGNKEQVTPINKYHFFNPVGNCLFVQKIPTFISINQLLEEAKKTTGLIAIMLSEPIKKDNYGRFCWFSYDNETNCKNASEVLKEITIDNYHLSTSLGSTVISNYRIKVTLPLYAERIKEDLENVMKIIALYSLYYELNEQVLFNLLDSTETNYSTETKLDIMLLYLRKVFGFCYYCLKDYKNERNAAFNCGYAHLRSSTMIESREGAEQSSLEYTNDAYFTKAIEDFIGKGMTDCIKKVDYRKWTEVQIDKKNYIYEKIKRLEEGRFQCIICEKRFIGEEFIEKHIENKHAELIKENVFHKYTSKISYDNFINCIDKEQYYPNELKKTITSLEQYNKDLGIVKEKGSLFKPLSFKQKNRHYKDYDSSENQIVSQLPKISYDDL